MVSVEPLAAEEGRVAMQLTQKTYSDPGPSCGMSRRSRMAAGRNSRWQENAARCMSVSRGRIAGADYFRAAGVGLLVDVGDGSVKRRAPPGGSDAMYYLL